MTTTQEIYNRRVSLQQWLDEKYPKGCYVSVCHRWDNGYIEPVYNVIASRPFVIGYKDIGTNELYQVSFDPITSQDDASLTDDPPVLWIEGFYESDPVFEAVTFSDDGQPVAQDLTNRQGKTYRLESVQVVRLIEGKGENAAKAEDREYVTELYEPLYFPAGVKEVEDE